MDSVVDNVTVVRFQVRLIEWTFLDFGDFQSAAFIGTFVKFDFIDYRIFLLVVRSSFFH